MIALWMVCFYGLLKGFTFGVIWYIHKYGKIALVGFVVIGVTLAMFIPGGSEAMLSTFKSWDYELSNAIGIILGAQLGRYAVEVIKDEF